MFYFSGTAIGAGNCTACDAVWFYRKILYVYKEFEQIQKGYQNIRILMLVSERTCIGEGAMLQIMYLEETGHFFQVGFKSWTLKTSVCNWMAWCKRDVSDFFRWNFFSFKSAWIFACAF